MGFNIKSTVISFLLFFSFINSGSADPNTQASFNHWLEHQQDFSCVALLKNIHPKDTIPGTVVASPSREKPAYFYHWVRDGALVMDVIVKLYENETDSWKKENFFKLILDYLGLSEKHQRSKAISGLGEPKFEVNGEPFMGEWGRPQNDGPALRAIALSRFAMLMLKEGKPEIAKRVYSNSLPAQAGIKADLEYTVAQYPNPSHDLWEEVNGQHFYTLVVQRKALLDGAEVAEKLNDFRAASWYRAHARLIESYIEKHFTPLGRDAQGEYILATLNFKGGVVDYKFSGLDTAVILAVLHTDPNDSFLPIIRDQLLSTLVHLEDEFKETYPINQDKSLGTAIGRYPEDQYYGGNPWVLTTQGVAQAYYEIAHRLSREGKIEISELNSDFFSRILGKKMAAGAVVNSADKTYSIILRKLIEKGDSFLKRVRAHTNPDGSSSEQIHKITGKPLAAYNLTWNFSSFLTAKWARQRAVDSTR